jgi:hypothetical protein
MSRSSHHPVPFGSPHSNRWPSSYDQSPRVQPFQSVVSGRLQVYSVRILVPLVPVITIPIDGSHHMIDRLRYSTISLLLFPVPSGLQSSIQRQDSRAPGSRSYYSSRRPSPYDRSPQVQLYQSVLSCSFQLTPAYRIQRRDYRASERDPRLSINCPPNRQVQSPQCHFLFPA